MSAFIVSDDTITCIAKAFTTYGIEFRGGRAKTTMEMILFMEESEIKRIGQALLDENYRSVNFRYGEENEAPEFEPTELDEFDEGIVMGCIECYEYQACETNDWEETLVYKDIQRLKSKILMRLLKKFNMKMPYGYHGYDMLEEGI